MMSETVGATWCRMSCTWPIKSNEFNDSWVSFQFRIIHGFESQRGLESQRGKTVKWSSAEPFDIEELYFFTTSSHAISRMLWVEGFCEPTPVCILRALHPCPLLPLSIVFSFPDSVLCSVNPQILQQWLTSIDSLIHQPCVWEIPMVTVNKPL